MGIMDFINRIKGQDLNYRSVEEVRDNLKKQDFLVVDVPEPSEISQWSLKKTKNIPLGQLEKRAKELPKNKEIVLMCSVGPRAQRAAKILKNRGFEQISVVKGGAKKYQRRIG